MALLTIEQQQLIKAISPNWAITAKVTGGLKNFEQLEKEVENKELKELVGVALLQDLQRNPTTADNVILLDGGSFQDCQDNTIHFEGLRMVLAYFIYSKYIVKSKISDSFTGMVNKNRSEATDMSKGAIKDEQNDSRKIAFDEWDLVRAFLCENSDLYPLWNNAKTKKIFNPSFTTVRATRY